MEWRGGRWSGLGAAHMTSNERDSLLWMRWIIVATAYAAAEWQSLWQPAGVRRHYYR